MNVGYRSLVLADVASVKVTLVAVVAVPFNEPLNVVAVTDDRPARVSPVEPRVMFVVPSVNPLFTSIALVTTPEPIVVDSATLPVPSNVIPDAVTFPVRENVRAVCNAVAVFAFPFNAPLNVVAVTEDRPARVRPVEPSVILVVPRVNPLFANMALVTTPVPMVVDSATLPVPSNVMPDAVTFPVRENVLAVASLVAAYAVNPAADGSIHVGCAVVPARM